VAVWLCTQRASRLRAVVIAPREDDVIRWGLAARRLSFAREDGVFREYLSRSLRIPDQWREKGAREAVTPWQFTVLGALLEHSNVTRAEAWDLPVAEALVLFSAANERHGAELISPDEERLVAELSALDAQMDREEAG